MSHVFELFPTPVMRVPGMVDADEAAALRTRLTGLAEGANHHSGELSHSRILSPVDEPRLRELATRIEPHLVELGSLLFGEALRWGIKEMWINVMHRGGRQTVHNHANCFISGVLYLSEGDRGGSAAANTVFVRSLGGRDYRFSNTNAQTTVGPFNADKWIGPPPAVGDLLLFPSYLLHEVPEHRGSTRVTLAFNAIPHRLDAWGYAVSLSG